MAHKLSTLVLALVLFAVSLPAQAADIRSPEPGFSVLELLWGGLLRLVGASELGPDMDPDGVPNQSAAPQDEAPERADTDLGPDMDPNG